MDFQTLATASVIETSGFLEGVWEKQTIPGTTSRVKFKSKHDGRELLISTSLMYTVDGGEKQYWDPSTKRVCASNISNDKLEINIQDQDHMRPMSMEEMVEKIRDLNRRMDRLCRDRNRRMVRFERESGGVSMDHLIDLDRRLLRCEHGIGGLDAGHPYDDNYLYQPHPNHGRRYYSNDTPLLLSRLRSRLWERY